MLKARQDYLHGRSSSTSLTSITPLLDIGEPCIGEGDIVIHASQLHVVPDPV